MPQMNRQVLLANRPNGWVTESDFKLVEVPIPDAGEGEVLVKNLYLSLDPYMRGRMNATKSYAAHLEIGQVMVGTTLGEVVQSHHPNFQVGDKVMAGFGWQEYGLSSGKGLNKINPSSNLPLTVYLSVLGGVGATAWIGLETIGEPKAGETVVVSAAAGAVGSLAGQLAKQRGCRVVGIAGGQEKCDFVVNELGFDACVDYKGGNLLDDLKAAVPNGIDVYFENVGGAVLDAVLQLVNPFARIPVCGLISQYNSTEPHTINPGLLLINRVRMQGFIVSDRLDLFPQAFQELTSLLEAGKLKYRETIADGLENAPQAFIGLLKGANLGKQIVKLA